MPIRHWTLVGNHAWSTRYAMFLVQLYNYDSNAWRDLGSNWPKKHSWPNRVEDRCGYKYCIFWNIRLARKKEFALSRASARGAYTSIRFNKHFIKLTRCFFKFISPDLLWAIETTIYTLQSILICLLRRHLQSTVTQHLRNVPLCVFLSYESLLLIGRPLSRCR